MLCGKKKKLVVNIAMELALKPDIKKTENSVSYVNHAEKRQQKDYLYQAYNNINSYIIAYTKEGVGIRSRNINML